MSKKLPYPEFSESNNNSLWVYDRRVHSQDVTFDKQEHHKLLEQVQQELRDSGGSAWGLYGDPTAKADEDIASANLSRTKSRKTYLATFSSAVALAVLVSVSLGIQQATVGVE